MKTDTKTPNQKMLEAELAEIRTSLVNDIVLARGNPLAQANKNSKKTHRVRYTHKKVLLGHYNKIQDLDWCVDNKHLVSCAIDGRIIVWNAYSNDKIHAIKHPTQYLTTCKYSPSQSEVAVGDLNNTCTIYALHGPRAGTVKQSLTGHTGSIYDCSFVDKDYILTASGDGTINEWNVECGKQLGTFRGHNKDVLSLAHIPGTSYFFSGSIDNTVRLFDTRNRECIRVFYGHTADVNGVTLFPNKTMFGTASEDGSSNLYDLRHRDPIATYTQKESKAPITSVAFSPSGNLLFAGSQDNNVYVYDTISQSPYAYLAVHDRPVTVVKIQNKDGFITTDDFF
uniref:WD_REPEATS_REGION domain-containing protein n=1 Tax=Rhabditophanes sp. KR3021 TaxID=114890 RepID=A0AC35UG92_9BILA